MGNTGVTGLPRAGGREGRAPQSPAQRASPCRQGTRCAGPDGRGLCTTVVGGQRSEPEPLPSLWAAVLGTERLPPGPAAPASAASVCTQPQGLMGIQPRPRGPGWALGLHVPIRLPGLATGPLFADVHEDTRDQGEGPRGARQLPVLLTTSALPPVLEPACGGSCPSSHGFAICWTSCRAEETDATLGSAPGPAGTKAAEKAGGHHPVLSQAHVCTCTHSHVCTHLCVPSHAHACTCTLPPAPSGTGA